MNRDIVSFKKILAGYKSAINVALADANLSRPTPTVAMDPGSRVLRLH